MYIIVVKVLKIPEKMLKETTNFRHHQHHQDFATQFIHVHVLSPSNRIVVSEKKKVGWLVHILCSSSLKKDTVVRETGKLSSVR